MYSVLPEVKCSVCGAINNFEEINAMDYENNFHVTKTHRRCKECGHGRLVKITSTLTVCGSGYKSFTTEPPEQEEF